ncbi:MAG: radical SAM protein [Candidatus Woesearchaeota archaeon]
MKTFYLEIDNYCNNNCIGCCKTKVSNNSLQFFLLKMRQAKSQGFQTILLSGGEFTIFKCFFSVLEVAFELFESVSIMTNGRMLSNYSFVMKLSNFKISCIYISLCGHNSKTHELWTRTPGSFNQTVKGIKNALRYNLNIMVVYILWKSNYKYINNFLIYVANLGVKNIRISNVIPTANARINSKHVFFNFSHLKNVFNSIINNSIYFDIINIEDFPFCVIPYNVVEKENISINYSYGKYSFEDGLLATYPGVVLIDQGVDINNISFLKKRINYIKQISNSYFVKFDICNRCKYTIECNGIFKQYVYLFGSKTADHQLKNFYSENIIKYVK